MRLVGYLAPAGAVLFLGLAGCPSDDGNGTSSVGDTSGTDSSDPTSATMVTGDPTSATAMNTMSGSGTSMGPTTEPPTSTTHPDTGTTMPTTATDGPTSGSSSGGGSVCDPADDDTECDTCIKGMCCEDLEACDEDGDETMGCSCLATCAGEAANPAELQTCLVDCDVQFNNPFVTALLMCAGRSCGGTCAMLPGG